MKRIIIAPRIELPRKERVDDENFANITASDDLAVVGNERRASRQSRSR
jgi:hypothetical protein